MSEPSFSTDVQKNDITIPDQEPFDWGGLHMSNPYAPIDLITKKFNATMDTASEMYNILVGSSGDSGLLGELYSLIAALPAPDINVNYVAVPDLSINIASRPVPDMIGLNLNFPTFDEILPTLSPIPDVDISGLEPGKLPDDITKAISWYESNYDTALFDQLFTSLLSDLTNGAGGLGGTIEQDLYDRAIARQTTDNDRAYDEVDKLYSGSRWPLPSGAYVGAIEEVSAKIAVKNLDINIEILKQEAELAQKNQQFVITSMTTLEQLQQDFHHKTNDRSLDYSKAVAANAIAIYSENIKGYAAKAQAALAYVQLQVANLEAVVSGNQGLVDSFKAEAEAYSYVISAMSVKNTAIIDVYSAEIDGYEAETKALSANQDTQLKSWGLKIDNAKVQLESEIASAEALLNAYVAESSLREKITEAMANIAMQAMASAYGAVNASAGLSYNGSESQSESFGHTENRSLNVGHSATTTNSYSASEKKGESLSGSYNHSYEEK